MQRLNATAPTLEPIEALTRRRLFATVPMLALLATVGCSEDDEGDAATSTRSVTTAWGTYPIPTDPQRIVLMENRVELEAAIALGLSPIAIGQFYEFTGGPASYVAPWVPYKPSGDEQIFPAFETDIEYILNLDPDLIISGDFWLGNAETPGRSYETLSAAAPVLPVGETSWRAELEQMAGWLGRQEHLAKTFREFDELRDSIKARHASRLARAKVAMGSIEPPSLWLTDFAAKNPAALALEELGGQLMPFREPGKAVDGWYEFSPERLNELDAADAILMWAPTPVIIEEMAENPLWQLVPAVKAGHALLSPQNVGSGFVYTVMECMRLWDQVYSKLA